MSHQAQPFSGELMTCVMCDKAEQSDPNVGSDWRAVDYQGRRYYACPDHFPPDTGTREQFRQAYIAVLKRIVEGQS